MAHACLGTPAPSAFAAGRTHVDGAGMTKEGSEVKQFNKANAPGYSADEIKTLNNIFEAERLAERIDESDGVACARLRKYILERMRPFRDQ